MYQKYFKKWSLVMFKFILYVIAYLPVICSLVV